jgi:EAL domain-containing protein (putative c-di-GMP-specific phosphodiesterase class I)
VIVEGVESADQARLCRDYGAHVLQGFVFSPPLASRDFETMVGTRRQQA